MTNISVWQQLPKYQISTIEFSTLIFVCLTGLPSGKMGDIWWIFHIFKYLFGCRQFWSESTNVTDIAEWQHLPKLNFSHGNINAPVTPAKGQTVHSNWDSETNGKLYISPILVAIKEIIQFHFASLLLLCCVIIFLAHSMFEDNSEGDLVHNYSLNTTHIPKELWTMRHSLYIWH